MSADWLNSPFERRAIQHAMKVWDEDGVLLGRVKAIGQTVVFIYQRPKPELWAVPLSRVRALSGKGVTVSGKARDVLEPAGERWGQEIVTAIHPLAANAHASKAE